MNRAVVIAVGVVIMLSAWGAYYPEFLYWELFVGMFVWHAKHGLAIVFGAWFVVEFSRALIQWARTDNGR